MTRNATSKEFCSGDSVYYECPDDKFNSWHGPGKVIGIESKIVFVRHGGDLVRVSLAHLKTVKESSRVLPVPQKEVSSLKPVALPFHPQSYPLENNLSSFDDMILITADVDESFMSLESAPVGIEEDTDDNEVAVEMRVIFTEQEKYRRICDK